MPTRILCLLALAVATTFPTTTAAAARPDTAAIDQFITAQLADQRVPGLALAIVRGDEVVYVKGYGTAGAGKPVTPETQFLLASLSKSITALAVMQLVDAGEVDLDAPLQRYLPDFALADPHQAAAITVRHLLNQVSGLADAGFPESELPQPDTIAERETSLRTARPVAPPGAEYHYFNPNYALLARLVEVVSGQPFGEYLQAHIFAPLGMEHSFAATTSTEGVARATNLAQGYGVVFGMPVPLPELHSYLGGNGGVVSTASDMARLLLANLHEGRFAGRMLASPAAIAAMHTPPPGSISHYAMGWVAQTEEGTPTLEHNGVLATYYGDAVLLPERDYGFVFLANANSATSAFLGYSHIRRGLLDLLTGRQPTRSSFTVGAVGAGMGVITLLGVGLALWSLARGPRLRQKLGMRPMWRFIPGIVWAFTPGAVFLALPALLAPLADRTFGHAILLRSMPDVLLWLGATGLLGALNGTLRVIGLVRWKNCKSSI